MKNTIYILVLTLTSLNVYSQIEIFNQDFQQGIPPATYTIVDNDGLTPDANVSEFTDAWINAINPDDNLDTVAASTSYFSPTGQADRWLITPDITLGPFGNVLYWDAKSHDPSYPDDYLVLVSRTDTQLSSFTDTVFNVVNELATWQNRVVSLSDSLLDSETIHIAFVNRTYDGFKLYIDDIKVVTEDPLGISENNISKLTIYPNPANDALNIVGIGTDAEIEVYSISGQHILSANSNSINISKLESGKYLLKVTQDNQVYRELFIKQ